MTADKSSDTTGVVKYGVAGVTHEGENPAIVKVETTEVAGRIVFLDPPKRCITFEDPQGKKRTLKLSKKINNLDQFKPGENLNMAVTDEKNNENVKENRGKKRSAKAVTYVGSELWNPFFRAGQQKEGAPG